MAMKIFLSGFVVFWTLLAVYVYSLYQEFFFVYWWWDIPMHLVGGVLAGLIGLWFFVVTGGRPTLFAALTGALVLGIGVEIAEYALGFTYSPWMSYPVDMVKDLVADCIGGTIALAYCKKL